jgi:hypothetical protein
MIVFGFYKRGLLLTLQAKRHSDGEAHGMEAGEYEKAERKKMMKEMMPLMMKKMTKDDPTMAKQTLTTMVPSMMKSFSGGAESNDMMDAMHEVAPKMETCMKSMKKDERREMLSFCRGMLDSLEKRFI